MNDKPRYLKIERIKGNYVDQMNTWSDYRFVAFDPHGDVLMELDAKSAGLQTRIFDLEIEAHQLRAKVAELENAADTDDVRYDGMKQRVLWLESELESKQQPAPPLLSDTAPDAFALKTPNTPGIDEGTF